MKLLKGFVIALTGLFVFITILSLFIPSRVTITRAVVINSGKEKVLEQLKDLKKWKNWQPVFKSGEVEMQFDTDSAKARKTCKWITRNKTNEISILADTGYTIQASLTREGENDVLNTINVLPLADITQVQVEWNVLIKLKWYPWEKFYGIFLEKASGQGYEDALNGLKAYCEGHQ